MPDGLHCRRAHQRWQVAMAEEMAAENPKGHEAQKAHATILQERIRLCCSVISSFSLGIHAARDATHPCDPH